jgi:hypothetical protein
MPPEQYAGTVPPSPPAIGAQSPSTVQLPAQSTPIASHPRRPQSCCWNGPQEPSPRQVVPSVATPFSHLPGAPHAWAEPG